MDMAYWLLQSPLCLQARKASAMQHPLQVRAQVGLLWSAVSAEGQGLLQTAAERDTGERRCGPTLTMLDSSGLGRPSAVRLCRRAWKLPLEPAFLRSWKLFDPGWVKGPFSAAGLYPLAK